MSLLPRSAVDQATRVRVSSVDVITGVASAKALGFVVGETPMGSPAAFGMRGVGGSLIFANCDGGFTFALAKNRLDVTPWDRRTAAMLMAEIRSALALA